jgi:hypothetical protein
MSIQRCGAHLLPNDDVTSTTSSWELCSKATFRALPGSQLSPPSSSFLHVLVHHHEPHSASRSSRPSSAPCCGAALDPHLCDHTAAAAARWPTCAELWEGGLGDGPGLHGPYRGHGCRYRRMVLLRPGTSRCFYSSPHGHADMGLAGGPREGGRSEGQAEGH